ncbi:D-glycero-beta-D-manno-heptose 1-phosphate adenylyltransferase [Parapedobacter koreensis]|uniref:Bifunctional protein HldE n=1 Tax=Parapedobacter koreensis TaxID=332977 RepID=A0A1H7NZK9_9SPHI|nr:D-glycero-beta-D-manno-heptose 1-phosphate adenylyltransferase [Parapedobacter koreensis]SEL29060.1 D-beta-D-heptose 7-phosphate kinase / D-beta-D-heptose 1-phosphate adenosyltransferase [Parapedobacter koreensis]
METHNWQFAAQFEQKTILVIGDFIIDKYIAGGSTRLSPEAPVPVVDIQSDRWVLGGAANVAANLSALGAQVIFCSVIGDDADADRACALASESGVSPDCLIREKARSTLVKTRILADGHPLVRLDRGDDTAISQSSARQLIDHLQRHFDACDGVVIADYHKGVVTPAIIDSLIQLKQKQPKFIAVDSKRLPLFRELVPTLVKPNYAEAVQLLGHESSTKDRRVLLEACGDDLYQKTGAQWTVLTLDKDGSLWFENGKLVFHIGAIPVATPHVCGAGDTFVSACTLALLSGADARRAGALATAAATVAIEKEATSLCTRLELLAKLDNEQKLVTSMKHLQEIRAYYKSMGRRIVFTNGCFDILHSGHVNYLKQAKKLGDILIVGVNDDDSIRRLKGPERPINGVADRLSVLAGLGCIDHLVVFGNPEDDTPAALIGVLAPDVFVKGGDYQVAELPEAKLVESLGGVVQLIPLTADRSTTQLIRRIYEHTHVKSAII